MWVGGYSDYIFAGFRYLSSYTREKSKLHDIPTKLGLSIVVKTFTITVLSVLQLNGLPLTFLNMEKQSAHNIPL